MKKIVFILFTVLLFSLSCKNTQNEAVVEDTPIIETISVEVKIEGMTCSGCEQTIETAVKKLTGVESVEASHVNGNAIIKVEPSKLDTTKIKKSIEDSGYKTLAFNNSEKELTY